MVSAVETQKANDVVIAEAAAWIARLQGSERTAAVEAAFREWLTADPAHAQAFSRATDVWDVIPGAARFGTTSRPIAAVPRGNPRTAAWSLAACAALAVVGGVVAFLLMRDPAYTTAIGQQQTFVLDDGTRVSLNTDSKVTVAYSEHERRLMLEHGEGMFEVAREASRPFIVQAGREQIKALGTTFVVRKDANTVAVTLIEGKVELANKILAPGDRATVHTNAPVSLDRPKVETVTAWRRGEVIFDDTSLLDAASEINRYGSMQVVISNHALAKLRVSGVFETRNPAEFARAMAQLHRLRVRRDGTEIVLEECLDCALRSSSQ